MRVLILTSPPFLPSVFEETEKYPEHDYLIKAYGEYDWSDEYDLGISFMYPYKVPAEQLFKTRINFHPGPLPEYRGRNLCYHALKNGEKEFGATVHYMNDEFDGGKIIEVSHFPIQPSWCADDLSAATFMVSQSLFVEYLPRILAGEEFYAAGNVSGTYYNKRSIQEFIHIPNEVEKQIRAITYGKHVPKINIGGTIFRVVRE